MKYFNFINEKRGKIRHIYFYIIFSVTVLMICDRDACLNVYYVTTYRLIAPSYTVAASESIAYIYVP